MFETHQIVTHFGIYELVEFELPLTVSLLLISNLALQSGDQGSFMAIQSDDIFSLFDLKVGSKTPSGDILSKGFSTYLFSLPSFSKSCTSSLLSFYSLLHLRSLLCSCILGLRGASHLLA